MQTKPQVILAAMATTAAAAAAAGNKIRNVEVIHVLETLHLEVPAIGFSPKNRDVDALFRRDDEEECRSSALSYLNSAPTPDPELSSWFVTAPTPTDPCTLHAPSSLSEPLIKYLTEIASWAVDKADEAQEILEDCDVETDGDTLGSCSTPGTILFTSANQTKTVPLESLLESATAAATGGSDDNDNAAAPRGNGLAAAVAAAVGVAGLVMAL